MDEYEVQVDRHPVTINYYQVVFCRKYNGGFCTMVMLTGGTVFILICPYERFVVNWRAFLKPFDLTPLT